MNRFSNFCRTFRNSRMQNESIINFDVFWNATHDLGMAVPYFCRGVSERCDYL